MPASSRDPPFTPLFLTVKLFDIGLTTTYFFIIGIFAATIFDRIYGKFRKEDYKRVSNLQLLFEILVHLSLIGIVAYALRNIVQLIPFPLEGVAGFQHHRLKELEGGHVLAIVLFLFQQNLQKKIAFFAKRAFGLKVEARGE